MRTKNLPSDWSKIASEVVLLQPLTQRHPSIIFRKVPRFYQEHLFLDISHETMFDWTQLDNAEKANEVTYEYYVTAEAHQTVVVQQVTGVCGLNTIKTNTLRFQRF